MGNFVTANTALPTPKINDPLHPPTGNPAEFTAEDWNPIWTAAGDLRTHVTGWANVVEYLADPTGATDSSAAFVAANAASLNLFVPPGQFLCNFTPKTGTRIIGAGWYATTLRPFDTSRSVILIDRDASAINGYAIEIGNLRIKGYDTGTGHGIESTAQNQGAAGLFVHDVWVEHFNTSGVYLAGVWTSRLERVWVDWQGAGGHAFDLVYAFTGTVLSGCYAKALTAGSGKCGFRIEQGAATLINCNGTDLGDIWGIFGSALAEGDATDAAARVSLIGCNMEDFGQTGVIFRRNTTFTIDGSHFFAPIAIGTTGSITTGTPTLTVASATGLFVGQYITVAGVAGPNQITAIAGTTVTIDSNASATVTGAAVANVVRAIYISNSNVKAANLYTASNLIESKGVLWKNSQPVHCAFPPGLLKFNDNDFTSFWYTTGGFGVACTEFIPAQAATSCMRTRGGLTIDDGVALGAFIRNHYSAAFTTWTGATLAAGASTTQNVTLTNAVRGATALVAYDNGADNALPAGVFMTAMVVAANTVRVVITNTSGVSVTIPAGTLRVDSWQHF